MSGYCVFMSGSPPASDVRTGPGEGLRLTRLGSQNPHERLPHSSTYDDNIIVWASARSAVFSHSWTHSGLVVCRLPPWIATDRQVKVVVAEFVKSANGQTAALPNLAPISGGVNGAFTIPGHVASGGYVARTRRAPESVSGTGTTGREFLQQDIDTWLRMPSHCIGV